MNMSGVVAASPSSQSYSVYSLPRTPSRIIRFQPLSSLDTRTSHDRRNLFLPNLKFRKSQRFDFRCNSAGNSGENEGRSILDAFFLGRAVAEALSERAETAIGEFLSTVGRLQAEQQKQVQEFQEEVLEKARRAKEQAVRGAMEVREVSPRSAATETSVVNGVAKNTSSPPEAVNSNASSESD